MNSSKYLLVSLVFLTLISFVSHSKNISGLILDLENGNPLDSVQIQAMYRNKIILSTFTDISGNFYCEISDSLKGKIIKIKIEKNGYFPKTIIFLCDTVSYIFEKLHPKTYLFNPITVYSETASYYQKQNQYALTIEGKELIDRFSSTLATTLENELDISIRSMGPATTKPSFRGLSPFYFNIYQNTLPVKDLSLTAPDHAIAVDPLSYSKIEIIRGPRSLIYSNSTLGGIVNLSRRDYFVEVVTKPTLDANLLYESVYNSMNFSLKGEFPLLPFFFASDIATKKGADMKSALAVVPNTYFKSSSGSFIAGCYNKIFVIYGSINALNQKYGLPGGYVGAHPNGVDIKLERFNQAMRGLLHIHSFVDNIEINLSRSYYHHAEYEKNGAIGTEFLLTNIFSSMNFNFTKTGIFNEITLGASGDFSNQKFGGYSFSPNTIYNSASVYNYFNLGIGNHTIEFSLRYTYSSFDPEEKKSLRKNLPVNRSFNTLSASVLITHRLMETLSIGLLLSRSERNPSVEELYSNGPHLAAYWYEIGNHNLNSELGYEAEISVTHKNDNIESNASIYNYEFPKYIYPVNTGDTNYSQLLPIYQVQSTHARLFGFNFKIAANIIRNIVLKGLITYSKGINLTTGNFLPMIPPFKGNFQLDYKFAKQTTIWLEAKFAFRQNLLGENETATPGYLIFNLNLSQNFSIQNLGFIISISVDNITNKIYWNHLSRIKSIFPEPGRNFKISLNAFM